jgi:hypothetical protein
MSFCFLDILQALGIVPHAGHKRPVSASQEPAIKDEGEDSDAEEIRALEVSLLVYFL